VLELATLFEVAGQPPDLIVGMAEEARIHLSHPSEQPLLLIAQRLPRTDGIEFGPGLPVPARPVDIRIDRRQLGFLRQNSDPLLALDPFVPAAPAAPLHRAPG